MSPRPARSPGKGQPWDIVEASYLAGAAAPDQLPPPLQVEIAFAGRSNVGKSSLMNALMGRRNLVRTSSTPGCTRKLNFFAAKARDGALLTLVDLPGYGYAKRSKQERTAWAALIEGYLQKRDHLRAVVVLVDARRGLAEDDNLLLELVRRRPGVTTLVVATKMDKIPRSKQKAALAKLQALGVSAVSGEGLDTLWQRLRRAALSAGEPASHETALDPAVTVT